MKYDDILCDPVVRRAHEVGFMAYGENTSNRRHFYWWMPDSIKLTANISHTFSVHDYKGGGDRLNYSINHDSTSYAPHAIELLNKLADRIAGVSKR